MKAALPVLLREAFGVLLGIAWFRKAAVVGSPGSMAHQPQAVAWVCVISHAFFMLTKPYVQVGGFGYIQNAGATVTLRSIMLVLVADCFTAE